MNVRKKKKILVIYRSLEKGFGMKVRKEHYSYLWKFRKRVWEWKRDGKEHDSHLSHISKFRKGLRMSVRKKRT